MSVADNRIAGQSTLFELCSFDGKLTFDNNKYT